VNRKEEKKNHRFQRSRATITKNKRKMIIIKLPLIQSKNHLLLKIKRKPKMTLNQPSPIQKRRKIINKDLMIGKIV